MEEGAKPRDLEDRTFLFAQSVSWGAQAASLQSSAACRRHKRIAEKFLPPYVQGAFRQAAEKNRLAACAPQNLGIGI
jgi:hypothetical protein